MEGFRKVRNLAGGLIAATLVAVLLSVWASRESAVHPGSEKRSTSAPQHPPSKALPLAGPVEDEAAVLPDLRDFRSAVRINTLLGFERVLLPHDHRASALRECLFQALLDPEVPERNKRMLAIVLGRTDESESKKRLVSFMSSVSGDSLRLALLLGVAVRTTTQIDFHEERERVILEEYVTGWLSEDHVTIHSLKVCAPWLPEYRAAVLRTTKAPSVENEFTLSRNLAPITSSLASSALLCLPSMDDSQSRAAVLWYLDPSDANVFATLSGLVRAGGDDSLKAEVALMLGKRGDAAAAAVLVSAVISQSESAIPQALLDALTQCACLPPVQEWCRKTIDGATDSQALRAAIRISTQSKIPEMWSHLANLFESGAEEIRLATLRSITEFTVENRASVERIIRVGLGDREESVRLTAMMILNRTYGLSSRPYLEQLCVSDPSQSVRESAAWYLERLPTK